MLHIDLMFKRLTYAKTYDVVLNQVQGATIEQKNHNFAIRVGGEIDLHALIGSLSEYLSSTLSRQYVR